MWNYIFNFTRKNLNFLNIFRDIFDKVLNWWNQKFIYILGNLVQEFKNFEANNQMTFVEDEFGLHIKIRFPGSKATNSLPRQIQYDYNLNTTAVWKPPYFIIYFVRSIGIHTGDGYYCDFISPFRMLNLTVGNDFFHLKVTYSFSHDFWIIF